jgi:hypothetical protein
MCAVVIQVLHDVIHLLQGVLDNISLAASLKLLFHYQEYTKLAKTFSGFPELSRRRTLDSRQCSLALMHWKQEDFTIAKTLGDSRRIDRMLVCTNCIGH